jgi:hypothetical protein
MIRRIQKLEVIRIFLGKVSIIKLILNKIKGERK